MLVGAWALALLPVLGWSFRSGRASDVTVPAVLEIGRATRALHDTLLSHPFVYQPLIFCVGVVLLFSRERGRRRGRLDWTRRWGVVCSYASFALAAAEVLFLGGLVIAGLAAVCLSMPGAYRPGLTRFLVEASAACLLYGPHPGTASAVTLVVFSSLAVLLACAPLFDALRSAGSRKWAAAMLVAPLGLFALIHLGQVGVRYGFGRWGAWGPADADVFRYAVYFSPDLLLAGAEKVWAGVTPEGWEFFALLMEAAKWGVVLAIAVWLGVAQVGAWRSGRVRHRERV